jgi:hypothetical protein
MAARSISSSKTTDNPVGSAGVPMVKAVPILDTSELIYKKGIRRIFKRNKLFDY